jgi:hypothetical protein
MHRRSYVWAAGAGALATLLAAACGTDRGVDLSSFCRERPADVECRGTNVGGGGNGGAAGLGGAAGQLPLQGAGGAPLMGAGGVGGSGGLGGAGGLSGASGTGGTGGAGACTDTKSDAKNCGECGRECLDGGTCSGGACAPKAIATGQTAPYALSLDSAVAYWASPASNKDGDAPVAISQRSKDGGGAVSSLLVDNNDNDREIRVRGFAFSPDRTFVYLGSLDDGSILRFTVSAQGNAPFEFQPAEANVDHVTASGGGLYWTERSQGSARARNDSGTVVLNVNGQDDPGWLVVDALDGSRPYWIADGVVKRRGANATSAQSVVVTSPNPIAVEVVASTLFWADRSEGELRSAPVGDLPSAGTAFVTGAGAVEGFTVDAVTGRVYWVSFEPTAKQLEVYRAGIDGQNLLLLGKVPVRDQAAYDGNPFGAAYVIVDDAFVYFTDVGTLNGSATQSEDDGVIYRVAK